MDDEQVVSAGVRVVPVGVKIISILYYIGAVFGIITGLLFFAGAGMMGSIADQIPLFEVIGVGLFIIGGIIMLGLSVLGFFVGRGLWKARPWARIVAIIFACMGVLAAITGMVQGSITSNVFSLVVNLIIGGYLLFSVSVKESFTKDAIA